VENDNSPEVIREQMQQTRNSLTEKVEKLEEQVIGTMQTATDAVQNTVDTVKDTVDNVRSSVEETVCTVKETVRETFDISSHVRERPWVAVGAAVATGFVVGHFVFGRSGRREEAPRRFTEPPPSPARFTSDAASQEPSWFSKLMNKAGDELYRLGESAMNQAIASLRTTVSEGVPRLISEVEERITGESHGHGNGRVMSTVN